MQAEEILYGWDPETRIVAVETVTKDTTLAIYRRTETDEVICRTVPFRPWLLLEEEPPFQIPIAERIALDTDGEDVGLDETSRKGYRILALFDDLMSYRDARLRLREHHVEHLACNSDARMALTRLGKTLFKGMAFEDIRRMQFDLETTGLSPTAPDSRILLIAISDNTGFKTVLEGDEVSILEQFVAIVAERDPDVLEGHNILGFDFPYLIERAKALGVKLSLGRDGSEPWRAGERNYAIGGTTRPFRPVYLFGRHVVDTYLVVQRFDWGRQSLVSYGLKECARHFGIASEDRVELPRQDMLRLYKQQADAVLRYALQDVEEVERLASIITPVEFYQTQMVPDNYGQVVASGNGEKINSIFLRAYLHEGRAIPFPQPSQPYEGGYVEVRARGVLRRVVKADVESLYPSLMLTYSIAPASDTLGIFLPALRFLTERRLEAKRKAAETQKPSTEFAYWDGLQASLKVLINSFYGYLGGPFNFNDYDAARRVTEEGRKLVQSLVQSLEATGSRVIEVDTDGVYFVPPAGVEGEEAERAYVAQIGATLPPGIRLAFDGRYAAMLSLKTKNYALACYDGTRILKGASLRSRADENYGRQFLEKAVAYLLDGDIQSLCQLYEETRQRLLNREIPIRDLARRERVTPKTFQSELKTRSAEVAKGVPIGDYVWVYERADGRLGRLEEYQNDENIAYYIDKLYKFARRLEEAFPSPQDFDKCIPSPKDSLQALQGELDLFG